MRVYKEDSPKNTILKIQKILHDLDILTYESSWHNPYEGLYSVRIQTFPEDGACGQNGKGLTRPYALASAYAEFIERLQNKIILYNEGANSLLGGYWANYIKNETGYYEFKDEKFLSKEDILQLPDKILLDLFGSCDKPTVNKLLTPYSEDLYKQHFPGILSVPFVQYDDLSIIYIPFFLLIASIGSNGMAAGNSTHEGIYQALCEIIERYAASIVYYKMLTPPTIPDSFLSQYPKEYKIIERIKASGYEIIVKDFSCGIKLPVVGTILVNKKTKKYRLNIGTDTCFSIALDRTLTELFQGIDNIDDFMLDIPTEEYDYFQNNDTQSFHKRASEFEQFKVDSNGVFPFALFGDAFSYPACPEDIFTPSDSYKQEVKNLIHLLSQNGSQVYIRNVSILGFPSFLVYATDISVTGKKIAGFDIQNYYLHTKKEFRTSLEKIVYPLSDFWKTPRKIKDLLILLETRELDDTFYGQKVNNVFSVEFEKSFWAELPFSFLVSLLYYYTEEYSRALEFMKKFVTSAKMENNAYYKEVLNYFERLTAHESDASLAKNVHSRVLKDFNKDTLFQTIPVPLCPLCYLCTLNTKCITKGKVSLQKRIIDRSVVTEQPVFAD